MTQNQSKSIKVIIKNSFQATKLQPKIDFFKKRQQKKIFVLKISHISHDKKPLYRISLLYREKKLQKFACSNNKHLKNRFHVILRHSKSNELSICSPESEPHAI